MRHIIIMLLFLVSSGSVSGNASVPDSFLIRLDESPYKPSLFMERKNDQLLQLNNNLTRAGFLDEKSDLSLRLVDQNRSYENSSALFHTETAVWRLLIVALFFLLLASVSLLLRNQKALRINRRELLELSAKLQDSIQTKETYIRIFLHRNSEHLSKVERYKNALLRKLSAGESNNSIKENISLMFNTEEDYNNLLNDFDGTVMDLFPDFTEKVNNLMKPGHVYLLSQASKNRLNTELRILAMIRLGVDDNKQIASFLRITVQSVYNYTSKARSRAVNEAALDQDLMKIV